MGRSSSTRAFRGRTSAKSLQDLQVELNSQSGVGKSMRREIEEEFGRLNEAGKLVRCDGRTVFNSRESAQACREKLSAITTRRINILDNCTKMEGDTHTHLQITNQPRD